MLVERNQLENLVAELLRDKALLVQEKSKTPACLAPSQAHTTTNHQPLSPTLHTPSPRPHTREEYDACLCCPIKPTPLPATLQVPKP